MGGAPHRRRSFLVRVVPGNHLVRGVVFGILRHGHSARCHGRLEVPLYGPRAPPHAPPAQEAGQQDLDGQLVHRLQQREANHLHAQVAPAVLADKEVSPAQTVILGSGSPAAGAGARGDGAVHGGPPVDAFDAARVDVRLAVRVAQAPRVEEWQGVGLDECQVEEGTVRVDELEQKGLEDERVLVLRLGPVVLQVVDDHGDALVDHVHDRDPDCVERRTHQGAVAPVEVGVALILGGEPHQHTEGED
mmetsp:Transcript_32549/g.105144  ORF Transcript_32549/g.105144 Transcript_32549/m.105144 type:complete len:247 (+) Transcript_32549:1293-2033(+)